MKWVMRALLFAALTSAFAAIGTTAGASNPRLNAQVVASWPFTEPYGSFAESMALGPNGFLYVSRTVWGDEHNYGYVERFRPSGAAHSVVAGPIDLGAWELLTGIAFDPQGHLYVTVAPFLDEGLALAPGVLRVESNGTLTRVLTLPVSSFPNGLAVHGGYLYVADSSGPIWRVPLNGTPQTPAAPWLDDPALAPGASGLGANGVAFRGERLYVTSYDQGRIVTVDVAPNGAPGAPATFASDPALVDADGIAFDWLGNLWVAVNGPGHGHVVVVAPGGRLVSFANDAPELDYPTQPVFVSPFALAVENGSFADGAPGVVGYSVFGLW